MPINKNALKRYLTLDNCFRNTGRKYYLEDLLDECNRALFESDFSSEGIKRRQLFEDIKFMESEKGWSVPLERIREGRKVYYRYSDPAFSINNSPINETEAEQLRSALLILSRFRGTPQFAWVEEIIPKIEKSFGLKNNMEGIISFEENIYLKGIEYLAPLFNAILYKKPLRIVYKSFKRDKKDISVIHPYYLKQYNNRWYLLGQTEKFSSLSIRALDRIEKVEEVDMPFIENTKYDFEEYFEDVIGINRGKNIEPVLIKLWFAPSKAPYVKTKPLHGSQKIKKDDDEGLIMTIEVIPNYELKSHLLSYGNEVKVLSPQWLHRKLTEMAYK
jgi:predicted DNA-binding transcriptional regulator YafY